MEKSLNTSASTRRKRLKRFLWIFASLSLLLFAVLVVHIYSVTKPVKYDNNDLQLSRIDFKEDIDSIEAAKIRSFVASLPGVQNAMFNTQDNILVYGYSLGKQTSTEVYNQLIKFGHYKAEKFVVSAEQLNSGCPMGKNKNSFVYKLSAFIYNCFN
jgi:hypothetical protein